MNLTKENLPAAIAKLKAKGLPDAIEFDDKLKGFGLRLQGKRQSWIIQYRVGFKQRRLKIGDAAKVSPDEARKSAKKKLAAVELDQDPQQEKQQKRKQAKITFRSVVDDYLKDRKPDLRPHSYYEVSRYLLGYWKALHHEPIDSIERKTIAKRLRALIDSNGKIAASRARTALSTFFVWAMKEGLCDKEENPVTFTHDPGEGAEPRERVLTNGELRAVWNACGDDEFGRVIRLLILTGQRKMEVGGMHWDELKSDAGKWCIPGTRTKNHRDHELTLPPQAWAIIDSVSPRHGNDYLFGRKHGFTSWSTCKIALDRDSGVTGWTVHDLRRTCATRMADIGVQPHIIEAVLNHVSGHKRGVAGTYNRSPYEREVRNALAAWADHVREITTGIAPTVVPMVRKESA